MTTTYRQKSSQESRRRSYPNRFARYWHIAIPPISIHRDISERARICFPTDQTSLSDEQYRKAIRRLIPVMIVDFIVLIAAVTLFGLMAFHSGNSAAVDVKLDPYQTTTLQSTD